MFAHNRYILKIPNITKAKVQYCLRFAKQQITAVVLQLPQKRQELFIALLPPDTFSFHHTYFLTVGYRTLDVRSFVEI